MLFYTPLQSVSNSNTTSRERAHPPSLFLSLSLELLVEKKKEKKKTKPKDYIRRIDRKNFVVVLFLFSFFFRHNRNVASKHFFRSSIVRPTRKCRRREKDKNRAEKKEGTRVRVSSSPFYYPTKTRKRYRSCVPLVVERSYHCANFRKIDLRCLCTSNMKFIFSKKKSRELLLAVASSKYLNHVPNSICRGTCIDFGYLGLFFR